MNQPGPRRKQLGEELRHLREVAGLGGRLLAERIRESVPMSQSTVSRIEGGTARVSRSELEAWIAETDADPEVRVRLLALLDMAVREESSWRGKLAGRTHLQDELRARESLAHTVRNFSPTVIPGLLQTPEYAYYVIPRADLENAFDHEESGAARLRRQQALFEGNRRFEFVISESALYWPASQPELRVAQLDRIIAMESVKSVGIGILPLGEPVDVVAWHNFIIFEGDETLVEVETTHPGETITDLHHIELYRALWARLSERALTGAAAVSLIQRIANEVRSG